MNKQTHPEAGVVYRRLWQYVLPHKLIALVANMVQQHRMMALLVSHQPRDALIASARCAFVCDGRIGALDTTAEMLEHPRLDAVRDYLGTA